MKSRLCTRIAALFGNVKVLFFRLSILPSDLEHWSDPAAAEHPSSNISKKVCFSQIIKLYSKFECCKVYKSAMIREAMKSILMNQNQRIRPATKNREWINNNNHISSYEIICSNTYKNYKNIVINKPFSFDILSAVAFFEAFSLSTFVVSPIVNSITHDKIINLRWLTFPIFQLFDIFLYT